jgi:uncharacterized protein (DUF3820 family)
VPDQKKVDGIIRARKLLALALDAIDTPEGESAAVLFVRFLKSGGIGLRDILDCPPEDAPPPPPPRPRGTPPPSKSAVPLTDEDIAAMKMPFGKHKGETLQAVAKHSRDYLVWMAENVEMRSPLKEAVDRMLELSEEDDDGELKVNLNEY